METREPLSYRKAFTDRLAYIDEIIAERTQKLAAQPGVCKKPLAFLRPNYRERYEQLFLGYCIGESPAQLLDRLPLVIDAYEAYQRASESETTDLADIDNYIVSLWLVSFAILLKADDELWARLLKCIGNEGRDKLYEALVAPRTPGRKAAQRLLHARAVQSLFDAIAAEGPARDAAIRRYLNGWYRAYGSTYWIDTHKLNRGGFFGYWSVEAAGVVAAFGMDDSAFREMPFYPRDLVGQPALPTPFA